MSPEPTSMKVTMIPQQQQRKCKSKIAFIINVGAPEDEGVFEPHQDELTFDDPEPQPFAEPHYHQEQFDHEPPPQYYQQQQQQQQFFNPQQQYQQQQQYYQQEQIN